MSALDAMKEAVYFQEPYIFLEQYIFYLKEGRDVRFPDREDEADIRLQWQGILSYLELEVTDRFLDRLASFWVVVVRQLEGKLSETSLDVIAERIKSVMFEQSDSISGDETEEEIWQKIGDIKESVRLQLSDEMKVARFYENNVTIDPLERIQLLDRAIRKKDAKPTIDKLLARLGLEKKKDARLRQLSGGMKRRFQLAKALVHDPDIIILDEPTAGVDVELRRDLWQYLRDLHYKGKTILLTTHYIEEAELLCENVAIIDEGKILKEGPPKILTQELGTAGISINIGNTNQKLDPYFSEYTYTIEKNRLHFSVKDPDKALPKIIKKLSEADIHINSIDSNRSSLEDVFLNLTGKGINE